MGHSGDARESAGGTPDHAGDSAGGSTAGDGGAGGGVGGDGAAGEGTDLLVAAGVPPSTMLNWKLGTAAAVSADGKVIAGAGTDPNGLQETWIARLP